MYIDKSVLDTFPKTLVIRNTSGGMIWQIYHVQSEREAERLSRNATDNGFFDISLEDYIPNSKETFPDWRESESGQKLINSEFY